MLIGMRRLGRIGLIAFAIAILATGCSSTPEAALTVSASEATATSTPTRTAVASPTPTVPAASPEGSPTARLQERFASVVAVTEPEPGRWDVSTTLTDPRGGSGSTEAETAIRICESAVSFGATYVSVAEADGTTFVLYGHPSYGNTCTEV